MKPQSNSKVFAILNPSAGSMQKEKLVAVLKEKLGPRLVGVHLTGKGEDFKKLVEKAKQSGAQVVIAAGGDGTISQVAQHLLHSQISLLIIPSGTANVMAKELNIPFEPEKCLELMHDMEPVKFDAIQVGDRYFFSHVSVGLYSNIAHQTPKSVKKRFGQLAYIWNGARLIFKAKNWAFKLELDDQTIHLHASTIMVANVGEVGAAGLQWGPGISPVDGVLNVCVIKAKTWPHYVKFAWELLRFKDRSPSHARYYTFKNRIKIESSHALPVRGDGEKVGDTPVEMRLIPAALRVLVP